MAAEKEIERLYGHGAAPAYPGGYYAPVGATSTNSETNVNVSMGNITIETNATNADEVAKGLSGDIAKRVSESTNRAIK